MIRSGGADVPGSPIRVPGAAAIDSLTTAPATAVTGGDDQQPDVGSCGRGAGCVNRIALPNGSRSAQSVP